MPEQNCVTEDNVACCGTGRLSAERVEGTSEQGLSEPAVEQEQWKEETGSRHKSWPAT